MNFVRVLLLLLAFWPLSAHGQDDPFAGLAGSYDDIRHAVDALAVSASVRAEPTVAALQAGTLFVAPDRSLWIRQGDTLANARTGETGAPAGELRRVRLNNAVRRSIEAAGVEFIAENDGGAGVRLRLKKG